MVVPDANLLIYAFDRSSPNYKVAKPWWEGLMDGTEWIGLDWNVILAFIRISTNPRINPSPFSIGEIENIVGDWLAMSNVMIINPGSNHFSILCRLMNEAGVASNLVSDAHLAALAIENRATLHSHDRDFQRFSGLKLYDPIVKR